MVARVLVTHRHARRVLCRHRADVSVLSGRNNPGGFVPPRLVNVQQLVLIRVAHVEDTGAVDQRHRAEVIARITRRAVVVHYHHAPQRHVARVRHLIGECGNTTNRDARTRRCIGILTVRCLLDIDPNYLLHCPKVFIVLNCASEYGLSFGTYGRECDFSTPRSARSCATVFEVIDGPRSLCMMSPSRAMP